MTSRHFHVLYFRKTHSDKQWNFNHQQWFLNNNACTENKSFPLTHTHTHAGKECHLYCGDPPNVPCSALPLVFYATLEEPINLHNSAHRCHDSEAGRGRRSHHRLGHMTLIPIHLHPSINYTYDKTQARGHP